MTPFPPISNEKLLLIDCLKLKIRSGFTYFLIFAEFTFLNKKDPLFTSSLSLVKLPRLCKLYLQLDSKHSFDHLQAEVAWKLINPQ